MDTGHRCEVLSHFEERWCPGFEVADQVPDREGHVRYRLRRVSDGVVLPALFGDGDLRSTERA
jgi:hypothetical protein